MGVFFRKKMHFKIMENCEKKKKSVMEILVKKFGEMRHFIAKNSHFIVKKTAIS
jgi:hypothetical protein